jgi:hypothetical protein
MAALLFEIGNVVFCFETITEKRFNFAGVFMLWQTLRRP